MGGISIWQLLIVLGIVVLLFGTKKLRGLGTDLGGAIKGFKKAMSDEERKAEEQESEEDPAALNQKRESEEETPASQTDQTKSGQ